MSEEMVVVKSNDERQRSAKTLATVVYALQAASFLFGITLIIAVIVNYVKLDDVKGTWLESHFRWQIRTFWYTAVWTVLGVITFLVLIGYFILLAAAIWLIYRVVKGWLYLNDGKTMYPEG